MPTDAPLPRGDARATREDTPRGDAADAGSLGDPDAQDGASTNLFAEDTQRAPFPYMRWAKRTLDGQNPRSLGLSGLRGPQREAPDGLLPQGGSPAGPALKAALAKRYGVTAAHVHLTSGSSAANFLAYHTYARNGRVAVEQPAYGALHALGPAVGATLTTFDRDPACAWRLDRRSLEVAADNADLLVVTDLHNPSGKALHPDDLARLVATAEAQDALVLVDEVYLDFTPGRPSSALADDRVITTNSLTKVHGLGALRAGWILAHPERIRQLEEADDLVNPVMPEPSLASALAYLPYADRCVVSVIPEADARRNQVDTWVAETDGVSWVAPDGGLTGFLDLPAVDGEQFAERLWNEHGVLAVPGSFFQRPNGIRISYLIDEADLAFALEAMGSLLAGFRT